MVISLTANYSNCTLAQPEYSSRRVAPRLSLVVGVKVRKTLPTAMHNVTRLLHRYDLDKHHRRDLCLSTADSMDMYKILVTDQMFGKVERLHTVSKLARPTKIIILYFELRFIACYRRIDLFANLANNLLKAVHSVYSHFT